MNVSPYAATTGHDISRVEDFLVAMLWKPEMWSLFVASTFNHIHETPLTIQAVWGFDAEEKAKRLVSYVSEALDGERFAVWVEPVVDGDGFCACLALRAQMLEPVL